MTAPNPWITIVGSIVLTTAGTAATWGVFAERVSALEGRVNDLRAEKASRESVEALGRRVDDRFEGLNKLITGSVEQLRADIRAARK